MKRALFAVGVVVVVALVGWDFFAATTFLGDDYIFRAFARLEPNPWLAFVADKHGGEYYRPLPMLLWWVLERLSGGKVWVFSFIGMALHAACAGLVALLARRLRFPDRAALIAGGLFFISPAQREAALWFSASTDLLALALGLGALGCALSCRGWLRGASVGATAAALLCKESALVVPGLVAVALWFRAKVTREPSVTMKALVGAVLPHLVVAFAYLGARFAVLRGLGGAADPSAPWWGQSLQLASGLLHAVTAYAPLPIWVALMLGAAVLIFAVVATRRQGFQAGFAGFWVALTLLPLPLAGWVVGARYFYAPAVGLFLLLGLALAKRSAWLPAVLGLALVGLGLVSGQHRAAEVRLYRHALVAAEAAVADGIGKGHRLFLVRGAVKDLDLALKLSPKASPELRTAVVIPDVPASFIWLPLHERGRVDFLFADPPLPPAGAYRFGGESIVGLARREEAPDIGTVLERLPELRILRLVRAGAGYTHQDETADYAREDQ